MMYRHDRVAIELPDGRTAGALEMSNYGRMLQLFVRDTEAKLPEIADACEHNRIVDFLHLLADGYNEQLRIFRAAEQERVTTRQLFVAMLLAELAESERHVPARDKNRPANARHALEAC